MSIIDPMRKYFHIQVIHFIFYGILMSFRTYACIHTVFICSFWIKIILIYAIFIYKQ